MGQKSDIGAAVTKGQNGGFYSIYRGGKSMVKSGSNFDWAWSISEYFITLIAVTVMVKEVNLNWCVPHNDE